MGTFAQHRDDTVIIPSLTTHCPIMIRVNQEGATFSEEVCRCDVVHLKPEHHPGRCSSRVNCPVREKLAEQNLKVTCVYGLL